MSLCTPCCRLARPALSSTTSLNPTPSTRRKASSLVERILKQNKIELSDHPIMKTYLENNEKASSKPPEQSDPTPGPMSGHSIFAELGGIYKPSGIPPMSPGVEEYVPPKGRRTIPLENRSPTALPFALDPEPAKRMAMQRRVVMGQVRHGGRITPKQALKRTERELMMKSPTMKGSTKKLGFLARQIAGKSVDEALLQLRFSKKRAAEEIKDFLEEARDTAVAEKGMGLGKAEGRQGQEITIRLKDGRRRRIQDRTQIYVQQAWVGKSLTARKRVKRARQRMDTQKSRFSTVSVLLKEEATRIREYKEREWRKATKKVWTQLPDRPLPHLAQRQYPLW